MGMTCGIRPDVQRLATAASSLYITEIVHELDNTVYQR
jgi:hypothetical protein